MIKYVLYSLMVSVLFSCSSTGTNTGSVKDFPEPDYHVVVYGGTAAGAIAAISAARTGLKVALLEPRQHIGGMVSGGLGATDFGDKRVIGGMSLDFFKRVGNRYGVSTAWTFEPHVAEEVFRSWLDEAGVTVLFGQRIQSVEKYDNRIIALRMDNGELYSGNTFIDASYEGDILPRAGIRYTWGRESSATYGESLAGQRDHKTYHQFDTPISAFDINGSLLPLVSVNDSASVGNGDRKVQAYNFRLCLTRNKTNQVQFAKPVGYDPRRYELLRRYLAAKGASATLAQVLSIADIPNDKTDLNNYGPISTDYIGGNWDYPEADHARRDEIWEDHKRYIQGFLYFLANEPGIPAQVQQAINEWGLAKDEFVDTDNWPHQLYIREARRMIGAYVMSQADLQVNIHKDDTIGMGSYSSDSHHVQRLATVDGTVQNEGNIEVSVQPYEIPYRAIIPIQAQCKNLIVPVGLSASHVAFSSLRMEPQFMILGHAAGQAAYLAVRDSKPVQDINVRELQQRLTDQRQRLTPSAYLAKSTGKISINDGAATSYKETVNLEIFADSEVSAVSMQISKDGGFTWQCWEPYSQTRTITLEKTGINTLCARYEDTDNLLSKDFCTSIELIRSLFSGSISINGGAAFTSLFTATLSLTADSPAGIIAMQISKDGGNYWYPQEPFVTTRTITLVNSPGINEICARYIDGNGTISDKYCASIVQEN